MAKQIEDDFCDDVPVFIGVLNGAFMVVADLLKKYSHNCEVSFVKMASYEGTQTTNEVKELIGLNQSLEGRSVIIVEDIVDTGYSMAILLDILNARRPKSLSVCALLSKPDRREVDVPIDYIGFTIPNHWVEGYGLDTNEKCRCLKDITRRI